MTGESRGKGRRSQARSCLVFGLWVVLEILDNHIAELAPAYAIWNTCFPAPDARYPFLDRQSIGDADNIPCAVRLSEDREVKS